MLRLILEEHGIQVDHSDEGPVLSLMVSGTLDGIKAAVAQLSDEFPNAGPVIIEGEDCGEGAANVQPAQPRHPLTLEGCKTDPPDPSLSPSGAVHRPSRASNAHSPPSPVVPAQRAANPERTEGADVAQAQSANSRPAVGARNAQETDDLDRPVNGKVVVVPGEVRYHRRSCILIRLLSSDKLRTLAQQKAEANGYVPCRACEPGKPTSAET